jgi:hypothetical protein
MKLCDEDCNKCPIVIHPNSRMITKVLNEALEKFGDDFYRNRQKDTPSLEVCMNGEI